ncbi:hypothetical protein G159_07885 [Planococcus glaciei CHR43]|nr:hypothetical protein G159_07885 [Planococcus glaciei CHR43]
MKICYKHEKSKKLEAKVYLPPAFWLFFEK